MWGHMSDYGWGVMGAGMLVFWVLLGLGLALLVRYIMGCSGGRQEKNALDILKERYARGEIGREEFEQKKRDLVT
ncbi:MAG: SHOCT domain-containing protein [Gammaproteobacteria bacterium]|nr:SHOCT domain-containing protein [Gammaproteobacteria bacterium]